MAPQQSRDSLWWLDPEHCRKWQLWSRGWITCLTLDDRLSPFLVFSSSDSPFSSEKEELFPTKWKKIKLHSWSENPDSWLSKIQPINMYKLFMNTFPHFFHIYAHDYTSPRGSFNNCMFRDSLRPQMTQQGNRNTKCTYFYNVFWYSEAELERLPLWGLKWSFTHTMSAL